MAMVSLMDIDFSKSALIGLSQQTQQDDIQNTILQSKSSKLLLNEDGLKLLQETTEAVRVAINKINVFKHFINQQAESNTLKKSNFETSRSNVEDTNGTNVNQPKITSLNPVLNRIDCNLQVFFTIPDNKISESEVREVFEKEGFEDFVITIKNRTSHSFGFIKFSNEDAVTRAIEFSLKMSVNGQLVKIKPHKSNYPGPMGNSDEASNVSQEIDESLLINISSGYQNHRNILDDFESASKNDEEKNEFTNSNELGKSFYQSPEPRLVDSNKVTLIGSAKENMHDDSPVLHENICLNKPQNEMEWDQNEYPNSTFPINKNYDPSCQKNSPFARGRGKKYFFKADSGPGRKNSFQRNFNNDKDKMAVKNNFKPTFNRNKNNSNRNGNYNVP